jgi:signal transduction histidine kinase
MESSPELPEPEETLPSALVTMAAETVRAQVAPGVTLNTQCDMPEEQVIKTQPQIIQLVLSRLLNNAAKFTKEGSITLSLSQEGGLLHFTVTDTGPGIPADKREFIFERFAKLDSFVQGTGLGLSIARMAAERLGGTLTLDSDYHEGAKFDLLIPISPEE